MQPFLPLMAPLITAAFAPELEPLSKLSKPFHPRDGNPVETQLLGVGVVAAAATMGAILSAQRPSAVILLGSCGAYASPCETDEPVDPPIGRVVVSQRVLLLDGAALSGQAAYPAILRTALESDAELAARFASQGCVHADVGTTLAVTTDDELAGRLARSGAGYENLEAFGVASACAAADVPFVAVLGVTNVVGSRGREQWHTHHAAVAVTVANLVTRVLGA